MRIERGASRAKGKSPVRGGPRGSRVRAGIINRRWELCPLATCRPCRPRPLGCAHCNWTVQTSVIEENVLLERFKPTSYDTQHPERYEYYVVAIGWLGWAGRPTGGATRVGNQLQIGGDWRRCTGFRNTFESDDGGEEAEKTRSNVPRVVE